MTPDLVLIPDWLLGERVPGKTPYEGVGGGLLGKSPMYNSSGVCGDYVFLRDSTELNHFVKRRNIECLQYFIDEHIDKIKNGLLKELFSEYFSKRDLDCYYNGVSPEHDIPFFLQDQFNNTVVKVKNNSLLTFAENKFMDYLKQVERYHRYLHVRKDEWWEDPNTGEFHDYRWAWKRLTTRYSNSYHKRLMKRLIDLSHRKQSSKCVLLVLTVDPAKYGNDKTRMWLEFRHDVNLFMVKLRDMWLRRNGERVTAFNVDTCRYRTEFIELRDRPFPAYLRTPEAQKKPNSVGNPHVNLLFFDCTRLLDWRLIVKCWGKGNIHINRTQDGETVRDPIRYVTKYVTKTFSNTDADNVLTQSLVWLFNYRSYSCSRGLIDPLNPCRVTDWYSEYFASCSPQKTVLDEIDMMEIRMRELGLLSGQIPPPGGDYDLFRIWQGLDPAPNDSWGS